ncbi:hypothetical protein PPERSA_04093 [Pseudocohnilembus persalinus]|uniref:Cysteine protease n=1 Tax=Pseudocohnilembus persalinus TaxID=266149 RepID=A0A0V0QL56_PSEPJ|nr:hypothetical protein PPERSA_04093 [Pseudocohnilembus persalinus]|eukprot:KRX02890.1 hypothetical protein PPERSA_04093 [Pseudocohnilembus persalinus]
MFFPFTRRKIIIKFLRNIISTNNTIKNTNKLKKKNQKKHKQTTKQLFIIIFNSFLQLKSARQLQFFKYIIKKYIKIQVIMKKTRPQTTLEMIQDSYYNMTYKFNKSANLSNEIKEGTKVYYLGEKINTEFQENQQELLKQNQDYLEQLFKSTIWFTYRKVFPAVENEITNQDYISDTGWGCMIRCGQMIFAQALRRHLNLELGLSLENYKDIILAFADDDQYFLSPLQKQQQKQISEQDESNTDLNQQNIQNNNYQSNNEANQNLYFQSQDFQNKLQSEQSDLQSLTQSYNQDRQNQQQIGPIFQNQQNYMQSQQLKNLQTPVIQKNKNSQQYFKSSPYSIQKIVQKAKEEFKELQQPGQWYNPNRICFILQQLHQKDKMPGAENLEICIMNTDAPVVFETILQKFCGKQAKINCKCNKKKNDFKFLEKDINKLDNSVDNLSIQEEFNSNMNNYNNNNINNISSNNQVLQDVYNRQRNNSSCTDFVQISKSNNLNQSNILQNIQSTPKSNQNTNVVGKIQLSSNYNSNCLSKQNQINSCSGYSNINPKKHKGSGQYDGNFEILSENSYQTDSLYDNNNIQNVYKKQEDEYIQPIKDIQKEQDVVIIDEQKNTENLNQTVQKLYCDNCHKTDKSVIIFIGCKIGLNHPEKKYLEIINDLLKNQYSIGMIGGKPQKALYFPGILGDKYIFLDPHKVQQYTSQNNIEKQEQLGTHFCSDLFTIQQEKIDSCLTLGFYLKNLEQLQDFYDYLKSLNHKFQDHNFIWIEDTLPYYINTEEDSIQEKNYDQFEINKKFNNLESQNLEEQNKEQNQKNENSDYFQNNNNKNENQQNQHNCEVLSSGSQPDSYKIRQLCNERKNFIVEIDDSD